MRLRLGPTLGGVCLSLAVASVSGCGADGEPANPQAAVGGASGGTGGQSTSGATGTGGPLPSGGSASSGSAGETASVAGSTSGAAGGSAGTGGAAGGSTGTGGAPPTGDWWNAAWSKRSKVTITDSASKEDATDFQVPITLDATGIDYAAASAAGADLRFVTAAGEVLKHQVDSWDAAGTSLVWLKLPKLTSAPTTVFLYYGNASAMAPADADVRAVWPAPYAGVWHLSADAKDSTQNGFDGANMVGGSFATAKLGKGLKLSSAQKDHIDLKQDIKVLAGATGCTFSAWINPTQIENSVNGFVIMTLGKWFSNNHNSYADFNVNADGQMISHIDPGSNTAAGGYTRVNSKSGIISAGEWSYVTYIIDLTAGEERFFKNGALADTKKATFNAKTFIDMISSRVVIGTEEDNIDHWYNGNLDELRIETTMRSPASIAAHYRAMTTPGFSKVEKDR